MLDKNDLLQIRTIVKEEVGTTENALRGEIQTSEQRVRKEVQNSEKTLRGEILNSENTLRGEIQASEQRIIGETGKFIEDQILMQLDEKADKKDVLQIKKHLGLLND